MPSMSGKICLLAKQVKMAFPEKMMIPVQFNANYLEMMHKAT